MRESAIGRTQGVSTRAEPDLGLVLWAWRRWALGGTKEDEDRYGLELLGLKRALESRHDAALALGDGLDDRSPVRAVKVQFLVGQIGRSERGIAGGFFGVAVEGIALAASTKSSADFGVIESAAGPGRKKRKASEPPTDR